jgi:hypothetical protein
LVCALEILARTLPERGFLIRGAVANGRLYQSTVFGDGLVRAYHIESTVAKYPRIMIPRRSRE